MNFYPLAMLLRRQEWQHRGTSQWLTALSLACRSLLISRLITGSGQATQPLLDSQAIESAQPAKHPSSGQTTPFEVVQPRCGGAGQQTLLIGRQDRHHETG